MQPFLGDLLMGGMRLRDLCGLFVDVPAGDESIWSGHFLVDNAKRGLFELGRPYLLMLDDGRSGRVVVTNLDDATDDNALRVEFQPAQ